MKIGYARISTRDQNLDLQPMLLEELAVKKFMKKPPAVPKRIDLFLTD